MLASIKERIRAAQYSALKQVNRELVRLYWDIGRVILERQEKEQWGKAVIRRLAADLQAEFPETRGYSVRNLWSMRQFYVEYRESEKLQSLIGEIGWTHNLVIMQRCKDRLEREFYIRMTRKFGWTVAVLTHHIESNSYESYLLGQTNFDRALTPELQARAKLAVRDEYAFDFLEMGEEHSERELERALVAGVEKFLRSMGIMFAFVGSQFDWKLTTTSTSSTCCSITHRLLRSLVAVELKVGTFKPEYVGKMQFYLAALDDQVRAKDENPSIGMILCKDKNRTVVEYALRQSAKPIGVATYRVTKQLPKELEGQLPSPEQIEQLLDAVENGTEVQ